MLVVGTQQQTFVALRTYSLSALPPCLATELWWKGGSVYDENPKAKKLHKIFSNQMPRPETTKSNTLPADMTAIEATAE